MNKTLNINLGGFIFHIDEDAYLKLERYLSTLKRQFAATEGGSEIIKDIEIRIAELFKERTSEAKEVISKSDVDEVIGVMGKPEDYLDGEEEPAQQTTHTQSPRGKGYRRVYRDTDDKIFGGVASGLAAYFNIDPIWIRILFVVLAFSGFSILFYVILWVVIPKATTTAEKLQMRGESVNVSNIEKSVREELGGLGENVKNFTRKATDYDYSKPANQAGNFLKEIIDFIINAIKLIFSFAFKLIGFAFLALGFIALFAIVIGLFSGGFHIIDGGYNFYDLYEFLELVTASQSHLNLLTIGVFMLTLAPLVLIIYLGVRIIFKLDPLGGQARKGLTGVAIVGFVLVLVSSIRIGLEFDDRSYYVASERVSSKSDTLYLNVRKSEVYNLYKEEGFNTDWMQTLDGNVFKNVELNIEKSEDGVARIKKVIYAKGNKRRTARENAQKAQYVYEQNDSLLNFDIHYLIRENDKYRGQEIKLTLYLPEGTSVFLSEDMVDLIYDIDNINGYWDFDMVNHTWKMTKRGLKCTDCPGSEEEEEETLEELESITEEVEIIQETEETPEIEEEEAPLELATLISKSKQTPFILGNLKDKLAKV